MLKSLLLNCPRSNFLTTWVRKSQVLFPGLDIARGIISFSS